MDNFNLEQNPMARIVKYYRFFSGVLFKLIRVLIILVIIGIVILVILFILKMCSFSVTILGILLILLSIFIFILGFDLYARTKINDFIPPLSAQETLLAVRAGRKVNWALTLGYHAYIAFGIAEKIAQSLNTEVNPRILLSGITKTLRGKYLLLRMGINLSKVDHTSSSFMGQTGYSSNMGDVFVSAAKIAKAEKHPEISIGDLLVGLFDTEPAFAEAARASDIKKPDIENVVYWDNILSQEVRKKDMFWEEENITRTGGIGKDWAAGYTNVLDQFSSDITASAANLPYHIIGHNKEIDQLERLLIRSQRRNVILVGDPGVGKKSIVLGFAKKIAEGKAKPFQVGKHIVRLDVNRLLAGLSDPSEVESRILAVFNEATVAGNIILFIENIDNLVNSSGSEGTVDATQVILPFLNSAKLQIIGTMSHEGYHNLVQANTTLAGVFEKVEVTEPNSQNTIRIVEDVVLLMEYKTGCFITYPAIKAAVELSGKYIHDKPYPEKAIDLLDEVITYATIDLKKKIIEKVDVEAVVSQRTKVPVGKVEAEEKEKLINLEKFLHQRVVEQDEAIKVISDALRRARAGLATGKRPIGNFLFLGPTGVGKTETCKALAETYFGSEKNIIRLDMSEYQAPDSVARLIGSSREGGYQAGILTKSIQDNPFTLVLLDEIEKANPEILNLFLQVMEDGRLTSGSGKLVDFTNAMIIGTSNAGAEFIRGAIKEGKAEKLKDELIDYLQKQGLFRPEFLNRFDAVVVFKPLSEDAILKIAGMMIRDLNIRLKPKDIEIKVDPQAFKKLAQMGFSPEMGARPMRRVIQDRVENVVAKKLLSGELTKGASYTITLADIS